MTVNLDCTGLGLGSTETERIHLKTSIIFYKLLNDQMIWLKLSKSTSLLYLCTSVLYLCTSVLYLCTSVLYSCTVFEYSVMGLTVSHVSLQLQDLRDRHRQDDGVKRLAVPHLPLDLPRCTAAVQASHMTLEEQISSWRTDREKSVPVFIYTLFLHTKSALCSNITTFIVFEQNWADRKFVLVFMLHTERIQELRTQQDHLKKKDRAVCSTNIHLHIFTQEIILSSFKWQNWEN